MALFLLSSCLAVAAPTGAARRAAPAVALGVALFGLDEALHSPVVIALSLRPGGGEIERYRCIIYIIDI